MPAANNGAVASSNGSAVNDNDPGRVVMRRADGKPINVLVVDDEPVLAELVSMALRYEGWEIATAGDGATAIASARENPPDVVVLDVMLPDMSGLDVLRRLREQIPGLPLLLLTAKDSVEDRIAGLTAGGDDYVTKPFSLEEVVLRLRALLRRTGVTSETGGAKIVVGDLVLDEDSHEVTRGGESISLTATEFELLRFMMRNSKRVLSKAQILDRVWSYDFGGRSNIVELYVSYLRKKIDSGREPMIHTLRGAGYVLKPAALSAGLTRIRSPRTWSLRTRLLVTQVALLAVVCAGIGIATEFALQRFLMHQLDEPVVEAGRRSAVIFDFGPRRRHRAWARRDQPRTSGRDASIIRDERGPGPAFLNAPGQAIRTVGAVIVATARRSMPASSPPTGHAPRSATAAAATTRARSRRTAARRPSTSTGWAATGWCATTPGTRRDDRHRPADRPTSTTPCCGCCVMFCVVGADRAGRPRRRRASSSSVANSRRCQGFPRPRGRWPIWNSTAARCGCPRRSSRSTRPARTPRSASSAPR